MCSILETLGSFNFDVLWHIKGLSLNAMIICMGTQEVVCIEVNNRVVARALHTLTSPSSSVAVLNLDNDNSGYLD
jgi:hypothetical protein